MLLHGLNCGLTLESVWCLWYVVLLGGQRGPWGKVAFGTRGGGALGHLTKQQVWSSLTGTKGIAGGNWLWYAVLGGGLDGSCLPDTVAWCCCWSEARNTTDGRSNYRGVEGQIGNASK